MNRTLKFDVRANVLCRLLNLNGSETDGICRIMSKFIGQHV